MKKIKDIAYNFFGNFLPLCIGIFTIPILIRFVGTDRFGIITLAWMLIGYFSLFDMGLGRALTQLTAKYIGQERYDDIPVIFWMSSFLMLIFSSFGAILISVLAIPLAHDILKVPVELKDEALYSIYILCLSLPFVVLTASCIGFLSAFGRFDIINAIRVPSGIISIAGPLLILPFAINLNYIVGFLACNRVITFFIHLHYCYRIAPSLQHRIKFKKNVILQLLKFGGWMTVSNLIGPIMVHFDRFYIGSIISVSSVAFYSTPYELVSKLFIIPSSIMNVLFPEFASRYERNSSETSLMMSKTIKYIILIMFPVVLLIVVGARDFLRIWLGVEFSSNSYQVMQLLTIGVFINCIAMVPFNFLQSIGKPYLTSMFHLLELIVYIPMLVYFVKNYGIIGASLAWVVRISLDVSLLFVACYKINKCKNYYLHLILCVCILFAEMYIDVSLLNYLLTIVFIFFFIAIGWVVVIEKKDRLNILELVKVGRNVK